MNFFLIDVILVSVILSNERRYTMFGAPPPFKRFDNGLKKPKSIKEVPSYLGKLIGGFFSRYAYIFKLV